MTDTTCSRCREPADYEVVLSYLGVGAGWWTSLQGVGRLCSTCRIALVSFVLADDPGIAVVVPPPRMRAPAPRTGARAARVNERAARASAPPQLLLNPSFITDFLRLTNRDDADLCRAMEIDQEQLQRIYDFPAENRMPAEWVDRAAEFLGCHSASIAPELGGKFRAIEPSRSDHGPEHG